MLVLVCAERCLTKTATKEPSVYFSWDRRRLPVGLTLFYFDFFEREFRYFREAIKKDSTRSYPLLFFWSKNSELKTTISKTTPKYRK